MRVLLEMILEPFFVYLFFGVAAFATVVALGVQSLLIKHFGMMTTAAVIVEVVVSFLMNFFVRKFVIFKG